MLKSQIFMVAATALTFAATSSSAKPTTKPVVPSRLIALSEADMFSGPETGCQLAFSQGNSSYVFVIGNRFTFRTEVGINNCTMSQEEFSGFGSDTTPMTCGGRKFVIRAIGKTKSYPEADSAETPSAMTMTEDGKSRTVKGMWSSAC